MTIYQKELLRQLPKLNCAGEFYEGNGLLHIFSDGIPLCTAGKRADLYWDQNKLVTKKQKETISTLCSAAESIREYVSLYEAAPSLGVADLPEYRRLVEYGDVVLGAMYSEEHGFMFSTWMQNKDKKYVVNGDYSSDFEYAKESFITPSRLIDKDRVFTLEEAEKLYRCIGYVMENCETLTYDQGQQLKELAEKLTNGYPQIEEGVPSFEQDALPQLNM